MTPREQAHADILAAYRKFRATEPVPVRAMRRVLDGYAVILADDSAQGDETDPGWTLRYQITKEYIDTIYTYTTYWITSHPIGHKPVPYTRQLIGNRVSGLGWPC